MQAYQEVYVLGEVKYPLAFKYKKGLSLLRVLADSGNNEEKSNMETVAILRGTLTEPKIIVVNIKKILGAEIPDVLLKPRDIIYVPEAPFKIVDDLIKVAMESYTKVYASKAAIDIFNSIEFK